MREILNDLILNKKNDSSIIDCNVARSDVRVADIISYQFRIDPSKKKKSLYISRSAVRASNFHDKTNRISRKISRCRPIARPGAAEFQSQKFKTR